ncbi:MAG: DUF4255 domain-containing protein [Dehalococcoidia bacterium]|nr:DUF4255 domain-containing protein [Dehalococcoidia bacterium]
MSNHLAIAAATSTFSQLLGEAARVIDEAKVTIGRPKEGTPTGINLFLYQVSPNQALRNADLVTRRSDGTLAQRPQAALDLHYLLTFYGAESKLEPQILMGSAVSLLHSRPILTREMIRTEIERCLTEDPHHYLATADLADQIEKVRFTPDALNLEELSKLWSVFFQIPYALSVAYTASVVLIEAQESPQMALPVRARDIYAIPFRQPVIEKIEAEGGASLPILADSTIMVNGQRLQGDPTKVRMGEVEVTIDPTDVANTVSDIRIKLNLGSALFAGQPLRAGVLGMQIVHPMMMGSPKVEHSGVESNAKPFVLQPSVTATSIGASELTLSLSPKVGKSQRVVVLLNEFQASGTPSAYIIKAPSNNGITDPNVADTDSITFSLAGIELGQYLVRVQVDGAQSPLTVDPDPNNPRYVGPKVSV